MNISSIVRKVADGLKPGEGYLIRMNVESIQTGRVALSQYAPGKFKTESRRTGLYVERLTGPRRTNKQHVEDELKKLLDTQWNEVWLGDMTIAAFRKLVPTKHYETESKYGKLYIRKRTERCYKDRVWLQIADMEEGETKMVEAFDRPFDVFRANIPPGYTVKRIFEDGNKHWVTKLSEMTDEQYLNYVMENFMLEYDFTLIPHKSMRRLVARAAGVMGLNYSLDDCRVRVKNVVERLEALDVGQSTRLTGADDRDAQKWLIGRAGYDVDHEEITRVF